MVQLVVNKLLHQPTAVLRGSRPEDGALRAGVLAELFALEISDDPAAADVADAAEPPDKRQEPPSEPEVQA